MADDVPTAPTEEEVTEPTANGETERNAAPVTQKEIDSNALHDEMVMKQQEAIDREISTNIPLVRGKEDVRVLVGEYATDPVYQKKVDEISASYRFIRRTRPDGNCFFRAFCYANLERLVGNESEFKAFREKFVASKDILTAAGFTQFTVDDFYDNFLEVIDKVGQGMTAQELFDQLNEQSMADYLVVYLRILTSAELRKGREFYVNFIDGEQSLDDFCQLEVEPMYKESDHIHIIALTSALGIGVRIVYMDRGLGGNHDFPDSLTPSIHLLYRPGHYDVIYPNATV